MDDELGLIIWICEVNGGVQNVIPNISDEKRRKLFNMSYDTFVLKYQNKYLHEISADDSGIICEGKKMKTKKNKMSTSAVLETKKHEDRLQYVLVNGLWILSRETETEKAINIAPYRF